MSTLDEITDAYNRASDGLDTALNAMAGLEELANAMTTTLDEIGNEILTGQATAVLEKTGEILGTLNSARMSMSFELLGLVRAMGGNPHE
jgi:hypothetical protein